MNNIVHSVCPFYCANEYSRFIVYKAGIRLAIYLRRSDKRYYKIAYVPSVNTFEIFLIPSARIVR